MARVYKTFFSKSRLTFQRYGIKEPRLSETKYRKCATSIVERVCVASEGQKPARRIFGIVSCTPMGSAATALSVYLTPEAEQQLALINLSASRLSCLVETLSFQSSAFPWTKHSPPLRLSVQTGGNGAVLVNRRDNLNRSKGTVVRPFSSGSINSRDETTLTACDVWLLLTAIYSSPIAP